MAYKLDFGIWGNIFAVPTQIVDKHIKTCGSASLKVLLVLLRHNEQSLSLAELAALVGLSTADAQDALNYWIASGVLMEETLGGDSLLQPARAGQEPQTPAPAPDTVPLKTGEPQTPEQKIVKPPVRGRLAPEEISSLAAKDQQVSTLLQEAQEILGKTISPSGMEALVSLYSYGGMEVELILMVIQYCVSIGKSSLRYIEKTAYDWIDRGIDTFDKAEQHILSLTRKNDYEGKIKSAFGIFSRNLTAKEMDYVTKWFDQYGFELPLIQLAYERTVDNTGKLSFPYCDSILSRWHEKGIKTPRQAVDEMNAPQRAAQSEYQPKARTFGSGPLAPPSPQKERYDKAHAELQQRRNAAREIAAKRKEEVYGKLPRLKQIDTALAKTGFEVSKAVLLGGNTGDLIARLREENLTLQQEKEALLVHNGYAPDYLEIPYRCKKCEDKGYRPDGEACDCLKELVR
ncbi:MAG: hypothetical protein DBX66_07740 [Clostridiales bacterium]|nr:MAG: hypothetical protein DBX66_07740 [Clostridiales bacterium]RGB69763.1 DnaD domain protein [Harryflintia acetispora]